MAFRNELRNKSFKCLHFYILLTVLCGCIHFSNVLCNEEVLNNLHLNSNNQESRPVEDIEKHDNSLDKDVESKKEEKEIDSASTISSNTESKKVDAPSHIDPEANRLFDEAMRLLNRTYARSSALKLANQYLLEAAELGHVGAREKMAMAALTGQGVAQSLPNALVAFTALAVNGNPRGQLGLGLMHAAGLGVNASVAHALIYLTFAALGGDPLAEMAMGYRYWAGIGVENNCETAMTYYHRVAKRVADVVRERAQAGGATLAGPTVHRVRLVDEAEAGFSFLGGNGGDIGGSVASTHFISQDLLQYYHFMAGKHNVSAQLFLGQLYYYGHHGVEMNHKRAFEFFKRAADADNPTAMAFLGEMLITGGEAVEMDPRLGVIYLRRSAEENNPIGQTLLGVAHLRGRAGLTPDPVKAMELFFKAADKGWAEAQLNLGLLFLGTLGMRTDFKLALKYLNLASQQGNTLANFHLAEMHATGVGVLRSCTTATEFFKNVAERGRWSQMLMYALGEFRAGRYNEAFVVYQILAELGYEVAQTNAAYLLEEGKVTLFPQSGVHRRALVQLQRSANQGSTVSRVKLGDYYYYGWGTEKDFAMAIRQYRIASDMQRNPQAMFNLAYMHEQGFGFKRDIHLAKRFYDMAAEASKDAQIPVSLALTRLQFYFWIEYLREKAGPYLRMIFGTPASSSRGADVSSDGADDDAFTEHLLGSFDWDFYVIPLLAGLLVVLIFYIKCRNQYAPA